MSCLLSGFQSSPRGKSKKDIKPKDSKEPLKAPVPTSAVMNEDSNMSASSATQETQGRGAGG